MPDTDLHGYYKLIARRFSNPKIGDTIRRLCLDGSNRQSKFIVPPAADRLKAGQDVAGLALESALWCWYFAGTTYSGKVIEPNDLNRDKLQVPAKAAKNDPKVWLGMEDIHGDVGRSDIFGKALADALNTLWKNVVTGTLGNSLAG